MKIVNLNVEEIKEANIGKKIEVCGRTCYNSLSKMTEDSHVKFIDSIVKSGHLSVVEHARIYFEVDPCVNFKDIIKNTKHFVITRWYGKYYISANVRAWIENCDKETPFYPYLKDLLPYIFTEEKPAFLPLDWIKLITINEMPKDIRYLHKERTFRIVCSRACSHQIVRHRAFSFSQQSQRYVNYSSEKQGHSINFIMPIVDDVKQFDADEKNNILNSYKKFFTEAEEEYFNLIDLGVRPEDARAVLPNATATILVMTGTEEEWKGFFNLRCDKHAQREIRDLANAIKEKMNEENN